MVNYINNKRFEQLIKSFCSKESSSEETEELMGMFDMLITNIITTFRFKVEVDDAKQECYLLILKILSNFNSSSGSAFNYFTTIVLNNLRLISTKSKRYREKMDSYYELVTGQAPSSL